jgi:L-asparaginase
LLIQTGGTLAMQEDGESLSPTPGGIDVVREVPSLARIADIESQNLFELDSGDLQPRHWIELARTVHFALERDDVDGVVVLHGTDTMSYTASALTFLLGALPKPVVLTGAQKPLADVRTDARANLVDAVLGATLPLPEVAIAFGSRLMRGCRTTKADAWAFDAFATPSCPALVELGLSVAAASHVRGRGKLRPLDERLEPRVLVVRVAPGLDPSLLRGAIRAGVKGLVLEGYGTGNLPSLPGSSLIPVIEEASSRGVPVVVVSQCLRGHVELSRYEGGAAAARAGAIDGGDMTVEAAITKMMVGLGRYGDIAALRAYLLADIAGERSPEVLRGSA